MTAVPGEFARNRAQIVAALERLRELLEAHAAGTEATPEPLVVDPASQLARVCATFRLSAFERDVLLLAAAPDLDGRFSALCAQATGDAGRPHPTFSLALAALPDPAWSAVTPESPLRHWRLVEIEGNSLIAGGLRADEAIVHTLLGFPHRDERLRALRADLVADASILSPAQEALADAIAGHWRRAQPAPVQLVAADRVLARAVARRAAAAIDAQAIVVRYASLPAGVAELVDALRLCERDALLRDALVVVECDDGEDTRREQTFELIAERFGTPLLVVAPARMLLSHVGVATFDLARPTHDEQTAYWNLRLEAPPFVPQLAAQFDLDFATIDTVAASVVPNAPAIDVWDAVRAQARPRLDALAERIDTNAAWRDLILPVEQRRLVRQVVDHVRHRDVVYRRWGFARGADTAEGLTVLFAGASGTGKSLAARVLANVLRLDLYRVDLSAVFSKYIGETEKNLRRIFDAAESGGVVLVFDEADALFGKRSEVSDSHDRHANVEVSYLLQRLERFNGVAILTTNMRESFDVAFMRRFRFVVDFPFPDPALRARIWKRAFPARTPTDALDFALLAKLAVPGGNIRNIALNAAVRAAAKGRPVAMDDVAAAARMEYAKLDRSLHDPDLARWLEAVPARTTVRAAG
ncbi:MAG: ATP-binding protein [Candidatus Eremiobacteraeota bacterium]|nr:ATP-binding protein [Candidatus Eremiobacteraeota bacterium]